MTPQEAIKILHPDTTVEAIAETEYYAGFKGREAGIKAVEDACVVACEALEKQIPKKVVVKEYEGGFKENRCPICKQQLSPFDIETYCGYCGQLLDFGE